MANQILSANAREAWVQACTYCSNILNGYVTLQYKKIFVAMLHNAVELLMKQRMININDYRVVKIRNVQADGQPAKDYYASTDLNQYFETVGTKDSAGKPKFYSIEFHEFHDIHKELFADYYNANPNISSLVSASLTLLGNLRNDEAHFYIRDIDFLDGSEFKKLLIFMVEFSKILEFYNLLPTISASSNLHIKPHHNVNIVSDYRLFLKQNQDVKLICNYLHGLNWTDNYDPIEITDFLYFGSSFCRLKLSCEYTETISLITGLVQYKIIKIKEKEVEKDYGDGNMKIVKEYKFSCNINK